MTGPLRRQLNQAGRAYRQRRYDADLAGDLLSVPNTKTARPRRPAPWPYRIAAWGGAGIGAAAALALAGLLLLDADNTNEHQASGGGMASRSQYDVDALRIPAQKALPLTFDASARSTRIGATAASRAMTPPRTRMDVRRFSLARPPLTELTRPPRLSRSERTPFRLTRPALPSASRPHATRPPPADTSGPDASLWPSPLSPLETS